MMLNLETLFCSKGRTTGWRSSSTEIFFAALMSRRERHRQDSRTQDDDNDEEDDNSSFNSPRGSAVRRPCLSFTGPLLLQLHYSAQWENCS